jgi:hypothetical protein
LLAFGVLVTGLGREIAGSAYRLPGGPVRRMLRSLWHITVTSITTYLLAILWAPVTIGLNLLAILGMIAVENVMAPLLAVAPGNDGLAVVLAPIAKLAIVGVTCLCGLAYEFTLFHQVLGRPNIRVLGPANAAIAWHNLARSTGIGMLALGPMVYYWLTFQSLDPTQNLVGLTATTLWLPFGTAVLLLYWYHLRDQSNPLTTAAVAAEQDLVLRGDNLFDPGQGDPNQASGPPEHAGVATSGPTRDIAMPHG